MKDSNLDAILDDLTDLAAKAPSSSEFYSAILEAATTASHATKGAIWSIVNENYRLEKEVGKIRSLIGSNRDLQLLHEEALEIACQDTFELPGSDLPQWPIERELDGQRYLFFGCQNENRTFLVIELVLSQKKTTEDRWIDRFMLAIVEIARDYRNAKQLERLERDEQIWNDFQRTLPQLHSSIQLKETAYSIANAGRQFLQCERVSVAKVSPGSSTLLAVSGVATIEHRAKQVRDLEALISAVAKSRSSLEYPSEETEAPQREIPLQAYIDTAHCQKLTIQPLYSSENRTSSGASKDPQCIGALIIESFEHVDNPAFDDRFGLFLSHAESAYQNALTFDDMPLSRISKWLQMFAKHSSANRLRWIAYGLAISILSGLAILIPAELTIQAKGTIQPYQLHHLYAPSNGEIVRLLATHQSLINAGDVVIEIRSREIELRKEELLTQRGIAQEKLRGIEGARLRDRKPSSTDSLSSSELSASERELRGVLSSQNEQLAILNEMIEALKLKSPIAGTVISWNPTENLDRRPVQQGQKLLSVAALDGVGRLHLRVMDEDSRHVMQAMRQNANKLDVTFSIASDPGKRHSAELHEIGTITESWGDVGASVRVEALVDASEMKSARPGATVVAKIHCGKSSIGYVWTRRLWDFVYLRFL